MNIIFDFDGTIADTLDMVLSYASHNLTKQGLAPISKSELQTKGLKKILQERKISTWRLLIYVFMWRRYLESHIDLVEMFGGLKEAIVSLSKENRLGIITSSSSGAVNKFLMLQKLTKYFDFVESNFGIFDKDQKIIKAIKQYQLDAHQTIYIGDETRDIEAAKKAGVRSIGVTWGFEGEKLIRKAKPDVVVYKPGELIKAVQRLAHEA